MYWKSDWLLWEPGKTKYANEDYHVTCMILEAQVSEVCFIGKCSKK